MTKIGRAKSGPARILSLLLTLLGSAAHAAPESAAAPEPGRKPFPFRATVVGSGRPMLFIPGLSCSGAVWDDTVAHFRKRNECHVLTLAGFAGVPPVAGPFLETMRSGLADYIRVKKLKKPILVGHSLGGFLLFSLGVTEPDLVGPLIAVDGLPCMPAIINEKVTPEELKQGEQIGAYLTAAGREQFLTQQRQMLAMGIRDEGRLNQAMKWVEASDPPTVARALGELWSRDLRPELSRIKTPVLLIAAPGSGDARPAMTERYRSQLAAVRTKTVVFAEDARHFIMYDAPDWMWQEMERFLRRHR